MAGEGADARAPAPLCVAHVAVCDHRGVVAQEERSEGASAKAWSHDRIDELSEERAGEVLEIWEAPAGVELPTRYADGEPIPDWVFALRDVFVRRRSQEN